MADKYFGLIWSITALVLGGMGAFGPPSLIRGYSYVKDKPEELNRIVGIYKSFGLFFFIVGHLGLVAT